MVQLKYTLLLFFIVLITPVFSQGKLRVRDKQIVNDDGPFIIRSIGTGNWMIQEGYMMQSTVAGIHTHTQFRTRLNETMGVDKTDKFYDYWLKHLFTKADLDSMKVWGFNALRPALHYKWFTHSIEDESRNSDGTIKNTWLESGFQMLDELVSWCEQNEMYIILDMHGAPGGQGKNADISDYDSTKPSLWESKENQDKLVALWVKIAERYKNNPWVGGFDLINETNWNVDETGNNNGCGCTNNEALWNMHLRLIKAIREVNQKHIVFISGNCWGNNYEGFETHLLSNYSNNMVLTYHKYWNTNNEASIAEWIRMRDKFNLPLWMSESGENSNHWFAEAIQLFEENNIGWSWWPVKKYRLNNVFRVKTNESYTALIQSWKEGNTPLGEKETYEAVMQYAEAHKVENCTVASDVIYAMLHNGNDEATKPFVNHKLNEWIQCVDYDLGKDGFAYHDMSSENATGNSGRAKWNTGNQYRNDGVDIGMKNGENFVGWTEAGEWLQYTINVEEQGYYTLKISSANQTGSGEINIVINGEIEAKHIQLNKDKDNWGEVEVRQIYLPEGEAKIRFVFNKGGAILKKFKVLKSI
ncbi:cellulase family glycosylhydrolase [Carboxylicivirga sp. N1Y90]|uniref:cellulase family glycosylhydrolase n=1 Tax=Carboxylicivirga fragile TaxID=3417571 RepID=UPI003D35842B|nr:cellulase family glycosylhydrolase [Marinilabiliaceae bacterium N1Y90]